MVLSSSDLINEAAGYAKYPAACYMYAPPKAAVLASVVLSFVPVAGGTLRRLFCLILYPVKLFQYAFALRRLLFFGRFSFDLLLPFCKLPLITLYYALSLIVGGHECLPVGIPMKCCRTSFQLLSAFAIRKSAAIFFNAAIWSILCGIRKTTKRGQVIFLQIRHEGIIENIIQNAETQEARRRACFLRYCAALSATCFS